MAGISNRQYLVKHIELYQKITKTRDIPNDTAKVKKE